MPPLGLRITRAPSIDTTPINDRMGPPPGVKHAYIENNSIVDMAHVMWGTPFLTNDLDKDEAKCVETTHNQGSPGHPCQTQWATH